MKKNKNIFLTENYGINVEKFTSKDGREFSKAILVATENDNTFDVKEIAKKNGAKWDKKNKYWFWWNPDDPQIKTCLDEIQNLGYVIDAINTTIEDLKTSEVKTEIQQQSETDNISQTYDPEQLRKKLEDVKKELSTGMSQQAFIDLMLKINSLKRQTGWQYSLINNIMIMMQDKDATMAKPEKTWKNKFHRKVNLEIAVPCVIRFPKTKVLPPDVKRQIAYDYCKQIGKNLKDLNSGERNTLYVLQHPSDGKQFLYTFAYDLRFTSPMDGYKDEFPDGKLPDLKNELEWFEKDTTEDQKVIKLYNASYTLAKDLKLQIGFENEKQLNGARGYTTGRKIVLLTGEQAKGIGMCSTWIHETAHALMHFEYVYKNNPDKDLEKFCLVKKYRENPPTREQMEQQAETVAFIVLRSFGYDTRSTVQNYIGGWGATAKTIATLVNTVADVSDYIYKSLVEIINSNRVSGDVKLTDEVSQNGNLTESRNMVTIDDYFNINGVKKITPYFVADLLGVDPNVLKSDGSEEIFETKLDEIEDEIEDEIKDEITLEQKEAVKAEFDEMYKNNPSMIPCFSFNDLVNTNGDEPGEVYFQYNPDENSIDAGYSVTNNGLIPISEYGISYDYNKSAQENIYDLYYNILEKLKEAGYSQI